MANTIWEILGISPTNDKRAIKKAYSHQCASCHPEDHPEEFDQLHRAYIAALNVASAIPAFIYIPESAGCLGASGDASNSSDCRDEIVELVKPVHSDEPVQLKEPAPSPELSAQAISQLVEKGMEHEMQSSCRKLLESFEALHASFPTSVNTDNDEYTKALVRLDEWFESPRFKLSGWKPDFLNQLDRWMSANRTNINRAEVVSLYRAYGFKYYRSPSYPVITYMDNIHWEVMFHSTHYEKDLISTAGMPPIPRAADYQSPAGRRTWSHSQQQRVLRIYMLIFLFAGMIIALSCLSQFAAHSSSSQYGLPANETNYLFNQETSLPSLPVNIPYETLPATAASPDLPPTEVSPDLQPSNAK